MDFVVSKVTPQGSTIFEIKGQTYDETIYDGAPPHMSERPCDCYSPTSLVDYYSTITDTGVSMWRLNDADIPTVAADFYGRNNLTFQGSGPNARTAGIVDDGQGARGLSSDGGGPFCGDR